MYSFSTHPRQPDYQFGEESDDDVEEGADNNDHANGVDVNISDDDDDDGDDDVLLFENGIDSSSENNYEEQESIDASPQTVDDLRALTVNDLKAMLAARGLLKQGNKEELIQRILNPQDIDFKSKPTREQWKTSKAKAFLIKLLMDTTSDIHWKTPEEVWKSSEWFQQYPKHRFIDNMKNIKKALEDKGRVIEEDIKLISEELAALNFSNVTKRGHPHWHTHSAKKLLAEDLLKGRNVNMKPKEFHATRQEFEEFPLRVFRGHIYQEQRKQREMPLKIAKRNKLAQKKYEQEVEAEAVRWHEACRSRTA